MENKRGTNLINLCYFFLFGSVIFFLISLNQVSLWGDELWTISKIQFDYSQLVKPGFLGDPNYPTKILFFKLISDIFQVNNTNFLVFSNLLNLIFLSFSLLILKDHISKSQLLIFISLIISSEFFIRMFLEVGAYGFLLGLSTLFSSCYAKLIFFRDHSIKIVFLTLLTGLVLSIWHPFAGLLVCSVFFTILLGNIENIKKIIFALALFFPILILITYSLDYTDGDQYFFVNLSFRHVRNTFAFMIPATLLLAAIIVLSIKEKHKTTTHFLYFSLPIIFSFFAFLLYSLFIQPIYQARYFISLFPLFCFLLIVYEKKYIQKLSSLVPLICLLSVIFLYGPRSMLPYTNFQFLIQESHTLQCKDAPIFFNNTEHKVLNKNMQDSYSVASKIYSDQFQRPIKDYSYVLSNIASLLKEFPGCSIFGLSGQKEQDVFIEDIVFILKKNKDNNITPSKTKAFQCEIPGCGILWTFKPNNDESNYN